MIHRHLQLPEPVSVNELPAVAIADILERGDLDDWRPLAAAVARDPFGALASRIARLVDEYPAYGTSALWRCFVDRCRARLGDRFGRLPSAGLADLRRQAGFTQVDLAYRMDMSQSDLSKLEHRSDVRLSTLRRYATALGGRLRVLFELGAQQRELRPPGEPE